jgi:hypothetical protein
MSELLGPSWRLAAETLDEFEYITVLLIQIYNAGPWHENVVIHISDS